MPKVRTRPGAEVRSEQTEWLLFGQSGQLRFGETQIGDHVLSVRFEKTALVALATFVPYYLFTINPAPYFKKYGKLPGIIAFVDGITAAVGAIAGAVIVLAKRSLFDIPTVLLATVTILLLLNFKKLQEPVIVAGAADLGLVIHPLLHG